MAERGRAVASAALESAESSVENPPQTPCLPTKPGDGSVSRDVINSFSPSMRALPSPLEDVEALDDVDDAPEFTYFDLQQQENRKSLGNLVEEPTALFARISITGGSEKLLDDEFFDQIRRAVDLRYLYVKESNKCEGVVPPGEGHGQALKYLQGEPPESSDHHFYMKDGVVKCWEGPDEARAYPVRSAKEFYIDLETVMRIVSDGPTKSMCFHRLNLLSSRFSLHVLLNQGVEMEEQKRVAHRDFYNVRKVDNHVHHSACMNQKHLLRFMKKKLKTEGKTLASRRDGVTMTLSEVFQSLNLTAYDLNIDALNMHAHQQTFHRFDKFNMKYNPIGESRLREIFIKTDNYMQGRFLAEITDEVFSDLEANKYQFAEYRLSIYGKSQTEWSKLAAWVYDNKLVSSNVRWMIQIPRLYKVYRSLNLVKSFQQVIDNIFLPLFKVTIDPKSDPKLFHFLKLVVGFDTVDDESLREHSQYIKLPTPENWTGPENPLYSMWSYYIYANLQVLNQLRKSKGMNTFTYRPHAGEAGDIDHLGVAFLLADSIAHGLMLRKAPVLEYLYYLTQIGVSMSPLSNNLLFVQYDKNPFPKYFTRGLNVTLSTDDPLLIHFTKEPLLEEYSVAAQVWKLSSIDMCEIARNSVLQSGFETHFKKQWLGDNYEKNGDAGNSILHTNIPNVRMRFRREIFEEEIRFLWGETVDPAVVPCWNN